MRLMIAAVLLVLSGCASEMKAVADCSYKAGTRYAGKEDYGIWKNDPEGRCSFHLEAPIKHSEDAVRFASSFDKMLGSVPKQAEFEAPKMKIEVKQ